MAVNIPKVSSGFTILEFVMVIAIVSILAATALLKWPVNLINVAAQADQLAGDIRYAQALAMTKGERYYLIRQSSTTYQILSSAGTPIPLAMGGTTMTLKSGITFGTFTNLPNNLIAFNGRGIPYVTSTSPGTALAATATMTLTAGGNTNTVSITPETGMVTVS